MACTFQYGQFLGLPCRIIKNLCMPYRDGLVAISMYDAHGAGIDKRQPMGGFYLKEIVVPLGEITRKRAVPYGPDAEEVRMKERWVLGEDIGEGLGGGH